MRAIIETGGKQFAVAPNQTIRVPSMKGEPGEKVTFDRVLYAAEGDGVHVGAPHLAGASVTAEIVKQGRGPKITVFKYKRRKRYSRKKGHRQQHTILRILAIGDHKAEKPKKAKGPKDDPATMARVLDHIGSDRMLLFSTDYPHWDFDDPRQTLDRLPAEWRDAVAHVNAARFFGLDVTVAA